MELRLLAVDDESLALSDLTAALQAAEPAAAVHAYTDPTKALEAVRTGEILPESPSWTFRCAVGRDWTLHWN